ncbi:helix-turn-helix domain-containing protein [Kitasatospora sp. NPDC001175]|uniref:helix-turn-helix domain-containing protein n=1 Tax=Kitasatospora sp. NPDC001175 TaxID=3157103 RepID=UPI003D08EEC1
MANQESRHSASIGIVAGYLLRLIRESTPLTQTGLAEALEVDLGTVQGWESGRRPLANMKAGALLTLRRRILALGASQQLVQLLDAAMDADRIITAFLHPPASLDLHPLALWVQTRETAHMVAWAARDIPPPAIVGRPERPRRGPVPTGPRLTATDRAEFFTHLRLIAETAQCAGDSAHLLRRQALYLASYDPSRDAQEWASHVLGNLRGALAVRGWSDRWVEARTTATVLARQGDPQALWDFIDRSLVDDDTGEAANLNYWAYWLGALPSTQSNDRFMRDRELSQWNPLTLLRLLVEGLHETPGSVDLYVHSMWAILTAHPWIPLADRCLAERIEDRSTQLLDGKVISARSRRDLGAVQYLLKRPN